jgi:hypothetical protein
MKQKPTIEERLAELYAEMDVIIDRFIDARAAACAGVPKETVRRTYLARASGCKCEEFRVIQTVITTAEGLAKRQADHAL